MHDEGGGASPTTEPAVGSSSGTDVNLEKYLAVVVAALDRRSAELRQADIRFDEERDRRYAEVGVEREKALRIKEKADDRALQLAREIQQYKDEKANELRAQIESERGVYISREEYTIAHLALEEKLAAAVRSLEATIKPITEFIAAQQGRSVGIDNFTKTLIAVVGLVLVVAGLILGLR